MGQFSMQETAGFWLRFRCKSTHEGYPTDGDADAGQLCSLRFGATNGQHLYVRVAARGPDIYDQIFNPDGSFLLDQMTSANG